ncbi:MAG: SIR2 family protein [Anaerolineae bacterium]|jgi:hypothetical protein
MDEIAQLAEALQRGNLALFLGADLPQAVTGLPSRADMAAGLTQRLGLDAPPPLWPDISARYEASAGLNALIRWLRDQLGPTRPGPIYPLLAQLPVTTYITTTYDTGLYDALREAGRQPNLPVVDASSLGLREANRPTVVHLFGIYDRPESLVLTAGQVRQLPQSKAQILSGLVHPTLANQSVMILGQDLRDSHFQTLYQQALFQAGTIRPPAYAVWQGLADWEKQTWLQQDVRVVDAPILDILHGLLKINEPTLSSSQPEAAGDLPTGRSVEPTSDLIVNVTDLLGKSVTTIEDRFGKGLERLPFLVGDTEDLPRGGESRKYQCGEFSFYVFLDRRGVARGFQVIKGLKRHSYSLDQWGTLLRRFGLGVYRLPDREAQSALHWDNFRGFKISLIAGGSDGFVWSVKIWQAEFDLESQMAVQERPIVATTEERMQGPPAIDPDNPPIAAIRDLLEAAFTAGTLKRFCQDRPAFRPLVTRFGPNDGLGDIVERIIVYCGEFLLWDALLVEVKEERPRQYARFAPRL